MILVINEWIFHDLLFDNGADRFRSTAKFVVNLDNSDDRIVMPTEERWRRKAFQLMTAHSPAQRQVSQLFHSLLRNTDRCIRLLPPDIPGNPQDPYDWAPPEDVYLGGVVIESWPGVLASRHCLNSKKPFSTKCRNLYSARS